jgi:hypothetical protein
MATKMTRKGLINRLGEDEAAFMQTMKTALVHLLATDQVDTVQLARDEMASRGLGANAEWIGFPAAKALWQEATEAAAQPDADEATIDAGMTVLAQVHLGIQTLQERNMDALDFHEVSVWQLKAALRAVYELGKVNRQ